MPFEFERQEIEDVILIKPKGFQIYIYTHSIYKITVNKYNNFTQKRNVLL